MKRRTRVFSTLALGLGIAVLQGCGGDRDERGLALPDEQSTPEAQSRQEFEAAEENQDAAQ